MLTFPMLPHLNRPGYGFHRFQGKTPPEKEVPVFIKQLFRLPVISLHPPPIIRQYAAGCSDWVATSKFGIRSHLNPTKAGRLNAGVFFSKRREKSPFEGLSLMLTLFHKRTAPATVAVPAGRVSNPSDRKTVPAVLTICTNPTQGGEQPLYRWLCQRGRFIAPRRVNGPRVTNAA